MNVHVSIHGLAWSPTAGMPGSVTFWGFQSTGSRGARRSALMFVSANKGFNPRARVEPDFRYQKNYTDNPLFQSTGSRGARRRVGIVDPVQDRFQSTGSRGARRKT